MTPNRQNLETRNQTDSRVRIFMFVRPRRILAALSVMFLALAGSAMALPVGGLPALPVAVPQTPDLPAFGSSIDTPVASAMVKHSDGKVTACANARADTGMLPRAPLPALPVKAPVAIPDAKAGAQADACATLDTKNLSASADAGAKGYALDKRFGANAGADASKAGIGADLTTSGVTKVAAQFFQALL